MSTFWESAALIGPLGFLYDEIISVDTDFSSTSLQLLAGRGLSPQFLCCCYSTSELTEMTNHWPLYLSVCVCLSFLPPFLCLKLVPPQFKPKGRERDLPSLDEGAQLYLDYYRILFWKSFDLTPAFCSLPLTLLIPPGSFKSVILGTPQHFTSPP